MRLLVERQVENVLPGFNLTLVFNPGRRVQLSGRRERLAALVSQLDWG